MRATLRAENRPTRKRFPSRECLVEFALSYVGAPSRRYVEGRADLGVDPEGGFDCSGFITFVLRNRGFPLSSDIRWTVDYADRVGVFIHPEAAEKGDLVFFSRNGLIPTHIGMLVDKNKFVHSPGKDGKSVEVVSIRAFLRNNPTTHEEIPRIHGQIYFKNPIFFKRLSLPSGKYSPLLPLRWDDELG